MNSSKDISEARLQKIEQLIQIVDESRGESASGERFNQVERRFFIKHPDQVKEVFQGTRSHVRANEITRKMKSYDLDQEDVETIHKLLVQRKTAKEAKKAGQ